MHNLFNTIANSSVNMSETIIGCIFIFALVCLAVLVFGITSVFVASAIMVCCAFAVIGNMLDKK